MVHTVRDGDGGTDVLVCTSGSLINMGNLVVVRSVLRFWKRCTGSGRRRWGGVGPEGTPGRVTIVTWVRCLFFDTDRGDYHNKIPGEFPVRS